MSGISSHAVAGAGIKKALEARSSWRVEIVFGRVKVYELEAMLRNNQTRRGQRSNPKKIIPSSSDEQIYQVPLFGNGNKGGSSGELRRQVTDPPNTIPEHRLYSRESILRQWESYSSGVDRARSTSTPGHSSRSVSKLTRGW